MYYYIRPTEKQAKSWDDPPASGRKHGDPRRSGGDVHLSLLSRAVNAE